MGEADGDLARAVDRPRRCYLCGEQRPLASTELSRYRVPSAGRGGVVRGVNRYVRMCKLGHGCKAEQSDGAQP